MSEWLEFHREIAVELADFLTKKLPVVGGKNWWKNYVLNPLTPIQAQSLERTGMKRLNGLDLAALVRVANASAAEMKVKREATKDYPAALKNLKEIRNRHNHLPADGLRVDIEIADLTKSIEFLETIGSTTTLKARIEAKIEELGKRPPTTLAVIKKPRPNNAPMELISIADRKPAKGGEVPSYTSYLGMDFGTSTTVVSAVQLGSGKASIKSLSLEQPDEHGVSTRSELVNTVLAYVNKRLIFGREAYRQRSFLHEGKNVFSSFKMRLGIDIGPTYPQTAVKSGVLGSGLKIESALDAATVFFRAISKAVGKALKQENSPEQTRWSVSVPASFEANQRRDLESALTESKLTTEAVAFIDEPNAAFLSYLLETIESKSESRIVSLLRERPVTVLVYDFGAGTCDVSILKLEARHDTNEIESRNLAISKFTALGGDDLDAAIARDILLPQLCESSNDVDPDERVIEEILIPRLQPTAELLKINLLNHAANKRLNTIDELRSAENIMFKGPDITEFTVAGERYTLPNPTAYLHNLADVMEPFISFPLPEDERTPHVFAPVQDAIEKSGLCSDDLDAVLFIGGSSENTIVRNTIMTALGDEVEAIVPSNLRTHVSKGAAFHSYWYHGCDFDFIQPITSEPILALTRGGGFEVIIPASTPLPSNAQITDDLVVDTEGQQKIEIPICVTSAEKLLGVIVIDAPSSDGFRRGEPIKLRGTITREKLLKLEATVGSVTARTSLLNPMANRALTRTEEALLKAKQAFNEKLLEYGSRIDVIYVIAYARAAEAAGDHMLAAEMFKKAEQIDPKRNFALSITYNYSYTGRRDLSELWSRRAYEREPSAVAAYNLAVDLNSRDERIKLFREALEFNPEFTPAMYQLGLLLESIGEQEGTEMLERCMRLLEVELDEHTISKGECRTLANVSSQMGNEELAERARARAKTFSSNAHSSAAYSEENLPGQSRKPLEME